MTDAVVLMALLADNEKYKEKLLEYEQQRTALENAAERAEKAQADLAQMRKDTDYSVAKAKNELAAKQKVHDDAAVEAAARIRVGNEQAAELHKRKHELDIREVGLDKREGAVADRETAVKDERVRLAALAYDLQTQAQALADKRRKAEAFLSA